MSSGQEAFVTCPECGEDTSVKSLPKWSVETIQEDPYGRDMLTFNCELCGAREVRGLVWVR